LRKFAPERTAHLPELHSKCGLFEEFSGRLSNRGIQLRNGSGQEFGSPSKSKVLATSATKVAFKFGEEPQCEGDAMAAG